jgi:hypothetical protein
MLNLVKYFVAKLIFYTRVQICTSADDIRSYVSYICTYVCCTYVCMLVCMYLCTDVNDVNLIKNFSLQTFFSTKKSKPEESFFYEIDFFHALPT